MTNCISLRRLSIHKLSRFSLTTLFINNVNDQRSQSSNGCFDENIEEGCQLFSSRLAKARISKILKRLSNIMAQQGGTIFRIQKHPWNSKGDISFISSLRRGKLMVTIVKQNLWRRREGCHMCNLWRTATGSISTH